MTAKLAAALALGALQAQAPPPAEKPAAAAPGPEEARAFVARVNAELKELEIKASTADWVKQTYITDDTERLSAWTSEDLMAYIARTIKASLAFDSAPLDPATRRMLYLLRVQTDYPPAPADPAARAELAAISAKLGGIFGKGKWCGPEARAERTRAGAPAGRTGAAGGCRDLEELSVLMAKSRNYDELLDAWAGWHSIAVPMRPLYERFVALSNEGAREVGFSDLGELWRSGYDMPPEAFAAETDRLWDQVRPLYESLHCYVRWQLGRFYGADRVPPDGPIPAHLLGNMWGQEWENIYPLVEPFEGQPSLDVGAALESQHWDAIRMVKLGEAFFSSLGFDPLPKTFWERSMFVKPRDREVVCHASAWDVTYSGDLRIKMCIQRRDEDVVTIHHELGHNYYQRAYVDLPVLFQNGANDGFHEAIGDAIALSVTPEYLKKAGLLAEVPKDERGVIGVQLKDALEKIAFLPFGLLVDRWRWDVFSGATTPAEYEAHWSELRHRYQGLSPPLSRGEADFDPGAKYHVAANVPYTRYFLARILQFQFHRAMCRIAGHRGPLHTCSIYGNKEVGKRLEAMLALGASRPWPDALEALTAERRMDASALVEYFAPLKGWLDEQNRGRTCGW